MMQGVTDKVIAAGAVGLGLCYLGSAYLSYREEHAPLHKLLAEVSRGELSAFPALLDKLDRSDRTRENRERVAAYGVGSVIRGLQTHLDKDTMVRAGPPALNILRKCAELSNGRDNIGSFNGVTHIIIPIIQQALQLLESGGTVASSELLKASGEAIAAVCRVEEQNVKFMGDVPPGSKGAIQLLRSKNFEPFVQQLKDASGHFLDSLSATLVSISQLEEGANRLQEVGAVAAIAIVMKGRGPSREAKDNVIKILRRMVLTNANTRKDLTQEGQMSRLSYLLQTATGNRADGQTADLVSILNTLYKTCPSSRRTVLDEQIGKTSLCDDLASVCATDIDKAIREECDELLTTFADSTTAALKDAVQNAISIHQSGIAGQQTKDRQREAQLRAQQQRRMQQQLMGGMGGMGGLGGMGGGMPMGMGGMEDEQVDQNELLQMLAMMGGGGGMGGM